MTSSSRSFKIPVAIAALVAVTLPFGIWFGWRRFRRKWRSWNTLDWMVSPIEPGPPLPSKRPTAAKNTTNPPTAGE
jgi:hypothetical protein